MSREKFSRFEVSADNKLNLNRIGLSEKEVSIFEFVFSISEFLNDKNSIETIKKAVLEDKEKILFVVLRESFNNNSQNIEDIPNVEMLHKQFKKEFKKEKNVFVFVKNSNNLESKSSADVVDAINVTTDDFSSDVNRTLEEIERQKEEQRRAEEERRRIEEEERRLAEEEARRSEEERLAKEAENKARQEELKAKEAELKAEAEARGEEYDPVAIEREAKAALGITDDDITNSEYDDEPLLGEKSEQEKLADAEVMPNDFDIEFQDPTTSNLIIDEDLKISTDEYNLKSIFDFIWRMFILYNKENQLDNLIYNITSHTPLISYAQNDFVRDLSLEADSLFDMILKLDYKLKFNNNLFYLYLSNLYYVKNNKVIVNMGFVDNFMVWEDENARNEFIEKISRFVNENSELVSKIIYSHFVEYSSYIKSFIPRIRTSLLHKDIYKIILSRNLYVQRFNIFKIVFENLNFICNKLDLNMYDLIMNQDAIDQLDSDFKINIIKTYNVFLDEIRNFILLDGSTEENINLLYKELTNIGTSYLVDIFQSVSENQVNEEDTLASIISYEQEKLENEYSEIQQPIYENVDIQYKDVEELYENLPKNKDDSLDEESTSDEVINTINNVDNEPLDIASLLIQDQENKNYLYNNIDYPEDELLGEAESKSNNFEAIMRESGYDISSDENEKFINHITDQEEALADDDIRTKIEEYEKRIRANIEMIEQERIKFREKTESLKKMNDESSEIKKTDIISK